MNKLEDLISYLGKLKEECINQRCGKCPKYLSNECDNLVVTPMTGYNLVKFLSEHDLKKSIEEMERYNKGGQD